MGEDVGNKVPDNSGLREALEYTAIDWGAG